MNKGTLNELREDSARTHELLTELIEQQKRTNELLAAQDKPAEGVLNIGPGIEYRYIAPARSVAIQQDGTGDIVKSADLPMDADGLVIASSVANEKGLRAFASVEDKEGLAKLIAQYDAVMIGAPVTIETVQEGELETIETVEIVDVPKPTPKKGK